MARAAARADSESGLSGLQQEAFGGGYVLVYRLHDARTQRDNPRGRLEICFCNGDMEELYHYDKDPLELTNLATNPELQTRKATKKKLFAQGFVGIK